MGGGAVHGLVGYFGYIFLHHLNNSRYFLGNLLLFKLNLRLNSSLDDRFGNYWFFDSRRLRDIYLLRY